MHKISGCTQNEELCPLVLSRVLFLPLSMPLSHCHHSASPHSRMFTHRLSHLLSHSHLNLAFLECTQSSDRKVNNCLCPCERGVYVYVVRSCVRRTIHVGSLRNLNQTGDAQRLHVSGSLGTHSLTQSCCHNEAQSHGSAKRQVCIRQAELPQHVCVCVCRERLWVAWKQTDRHTLFGQAHHIYVRLD